MAIPHTVFKQKSKERLLGKVGNERLREIRRLISELPGYYTGPYGEVRKWLNGELEKTRIRKTAQHREWFAVKKEGDVQIAIIGAPNAGKSSLLKALTDVQTKVAAYAFTTLKPVPAICDIGGAHIQLVEVPGLIEGAHEGRGSGKALLSVARNADQIILVADLSEEPDKLYRVFDELREAGIEHILFIAGNKSDLPGADENLKKIEQRFKSVVVPVSADKKLGLEELKSTLWDSLGLIRVFSKDRGGFVSPKPTVLIAKSTIRKFAKNIHGDIEHTFQYARVWGTSVKVYGERVGLDHVLADGDIVQMHH